MKFNIVGRRSAEFGSVQVAGIFKWNREYYIKTVPLLPVKSVNACKLSDGMLCCFDDCERVDIVPVRLIVGDNGN